MLIIEFLDGGLITQARQQTPERCLEASLGLLASLQAGSKKTSSTTI
jgi:hypothetical protein